QSRKTCCRYPPTQGPARTAAFDGPGVDGKSQPKLVQGTGDADRICRKLGDSAPHFWESQVANLVAAHLLNRFGLQDPFVAKLPAAQQHALELQVIACCR